MKRIFFLFFLVLFGSNIIAQVSKAVDVSNPGTLSTLLTVSEKQSITNLTVTGNIDVQDVKFMRDEMPLLAYLDITNVSIKAYTGNNGTFVSSTSYPANEFPQYAFCTAAGVSKNSLISVLLPSSITTIGNLAFYSCNGLSSIIIPNSVVSINNSTFQLCRGLKNITLGSGLTTIGDQCFLDAGLKTVKSINPVPPTLGGLAFGYTTISVVYVPSTALVAYKAAPVWKTLPIGIDQLITVNVPTAGGLVSSLTAAGFSQLSVISKLKITGNLNGADIEQIKNNMPLLMELDLSGASIVGNTVPANAFSGKNIITSIKLPSTIVSIEDNAFAACTNLTEIFPLPPALSTIGSFAFNNCTSLKGDLIIPNSVTTLRSYAFNGCNGLNGQLSLSENLTSISTGVFAGCRGLTGKLAIPESVLGIDISAFYNCQKLTELYIGKNTNTIEEDAFQSCSGLNKISVKRVTPPSIFTNTFANVNKSNCTLEVPFGSKVAYQAANHWKLFTNIVEKSDTSKITIKVGVGGVVKDNNLVLPNDTMIKVISGISKTFTIVTEEGYVIDSVYYRGSDVKSLLTNNQYNIPSVNGDAIFKVTFKKFYNLNVRVGVGGTVKENNVPIADNAILNVYAGNQKTFTILPNEGYDIESITYGNQVITLPLVNNQYTTPAASSGETLNVTFKSTTETYTITINKGAGGTVTENSISLENGNVLTVGKNGVRTFSIMPNVDYELETITYGGVDVKSKLINNQFTTLPVIANATLVVAFKKIEIYDITIQVGAGGSITENGVTLANNAVLKVTQNLVKTFTIVPNSGYEIATLTYGGVDVKTQMSNNQFITQPVTANKTLNVTFQLIPVITYNITVQIGTGGTVKENTVTLTNGQALSVNKDATKTFTFTPNAGYEIATLTYGGVNVKSQINNNQYTTPAVVANATLNVTFQLIPVTTYNLTVQIGSGGTVTSNSTSITNGQVLSVTKDATKTFVITPNSGYEVAALTYAGTNVKSQIVNNQYTTPAVTGNAILNVTFQLIPTNTYNISLQITTGGTLTENSIVHAKDTVITITKAGTKTFTVSPKAGYEIASLIYNGQFVTSQITNNQYTTPAVNANATLRVTFQKTKYVLSIKDASSGTINLLCDYGATPAFSFTPAVGWEVNKILLDGVDVTASLVEGIYTVPAITGNKTLNVSFLNISAAPQFVISKVNVYTNQSDIIIEGVSEGELVSVYSANGVCIQTMKSQGERMVIPAQADAVYLVKTTYKTYKVIL